MRYGRKLVRMIKEDRCGKSPVSVENQECKKGFVGWLSNNRSVFLFILLFLLLFVLTEFLIFVSS